MDSVGSYAYVHFQSYGVTQCLGITKDLVGRKGQVMYFYTQSVMTLAFLRTAFLLV